MDTRLDGHTFEVRFDDLPNLGVEEASMILRRAFRTQLNRFSDEFSCADRAEELIRIATDALVGEDLQRQNRRYFANILLPASLPSGYLGTTVEFMA